MRTMDMTLLRIELLTSCIKKEDDKAAKCYGIIQSYNSEVLG